MITRNNLGEVVQFMMGKQIGDIVPFSMAVYYVDGIMIDTGPYSVFNELETALSGLPIKKVVNTHHHEDHVGNNIYFQQRNIPILAHELTIPLNRDPSLWTSRFLYYQEVLFDYPPASECSPLGDFIQGDQYQYQVVFTPGHAHDHICLVEEENGWLFAGDLFRGEEVKNLRIDEDVHLTMTSLEKLLNYNFDTIYCCSGRVYDQAKQRIRHKLNWWRNLYHQAVSLEEQGFEREIIRDKLLGKENRLTEATVGDSSKINMINSLLK
ncbi:MAG: MBL fold metallo-hydrolase [Methylocystaceae bacterium]